MNADPPFVSVVIAARKDPPEVPARDWARRLDYPKNRLEIIVARGRQPSVQRNQAVREAIGDWIYFLDDDALAAPDNLKRAEDLMREERVAMVGGPNLCPPEAPPREQAFAAAMGHRLASGPSAARYRAWGFRRDSSEKELILCNLLVRKSAFQEAGGFDETLYPNEENALMDSLSAAGWRLVYDPEFIVHRRPRSNWGAYWKMVRTYGRGRAEQLRRHPTSGSLPNLVPPAFMAYLAFLALLAACPAPGPWAVWSLLPLAAYVSLLAFVTPLELPPAPALHGLSRGGLYLRLLPLLVLTHVGYGLGFWHGLFTRPAARAAVAEADVSLEKEPSQP